VETLRGRDVCLVCAIGNPAAFRRQALAHGARITGEVVLADHDPYEGAAVERIERASERADAILTTAKDWTKLRRRPLRLPVIRPRVEISFERGGDEVAARVVTGVRPATG
jgi:tetraacyldisaccharide-1-P 4'-kinase